VLGGGPRFGVLLKLAFLALALLVAGDGARYHRAAPVKCIAPTAAQAATL
jgi:hypothetical protein